jgi:hypothetical protein
MKLQSMTFVAISIIGFFIFAGCEKQGYASYEDVPSKDEILQRIDELPMRLHSRQWREVDRFAYSNICCAVRQFTNESRRICYSIAYTNKVLSLIPEPIVIRSNDSIRNWRVIIETYVDLVKWGFVLLNENMPMDPDMWDFLLHPIILIRQEIDSHKRWLTAMNLDSRHVEKNEHIRELRDLVYSCQREIDLCWYREAKCKMSPEQLKEVRCNVKAALGELPPEMAKDELVAPNK